MTTELMNILLCALWIIMTCVAILLPGILGPLLLFVLALVAVAQEG